MVKIKYRKQEFECTLIDWIRIKMIMGKLFLKRQVRRIKHLLALDRVVIYCVIVLMWIIYLSVVFLVGVVSKQITPFAVLLSQSRDNIFITVLVAFSIETLNEYKAYMDKIKRQHYIYVDTMSDFESFFIDMLADHSLHYHPMYNVRCFDITKCYIQEKGIAIPLDSKDMEVRMQSVYERINSVETELKNGKLIVNDEELLCLHLDNAKEKINRFRIEHDEESFWSIVSDLYDIQDQIRFLWRLDEKDNKEIIRLLYKSNKQEIEDSFYLRMQLDNFSIEMLLNEEEKILSMIKMLKAIYNDK